MKEKIKKFRLDELHHKDIAYKKGATKKGPYSILDKIIKTITRTNQWEGLLKLIDKNSNILWLETKIKPTFNKYGDTIGYIFLCFDTTDKYEVANIHKEANEGIINEEQEQTQQISAQTKFSALGDVIGNITAAWIEPLKDILVPSMAAQSMDLDTLNAIDRTNLAEKTKFLK